MKKLLGRLQRSVNDVEQSLVHKHHPVSAWRVAEGEIERGFDPSLDDSGWSQFDVPDSWGGYHKTFWYRQVITIPEEMAGERVYLRVGVPEGLLFIDGQPAQGLDRNHTMVLLAEKAKVGQRYHIAVEAYAGRQHGLHVFELSDLVVFSPVAVTLFWNLKAAHQLLEEMPEEDVRTQRFMDFIQRVMARIDFRVPGSPEFFASEEEANAFFESGYKEFDSEIPGTLWVTGHSHIDVAWLWQLKEVKRKCGRTFSSVLKFMEEYPDYIFSQSQPHLYKYTRENYPQVYERIKARAREGRWDAMGAMWVEADCNISGGEALVRQVVYGKRFFEKEFGIEARSLWLPDVFGYTWALPQILKKAGVDYFLTTKICWNDTNILPHTSFWWQGVDGTRILSHLPQWSYNGMVCASELKNAWALHRQKVKSPHIMFSYGHGDGGGGPTREHIELARRFEDAPGLPRVKYGGVDQFFDAMNRDARDLPVWNGELYLEYHRGTLTTHARNKRGNRKSELLLRDAEFLNTLSWLQGGDYPAAKLMEAWELLLLNQFHDIIPGSSIREVYEDSDKDYARIQEIGQAAADKALDALIADDGDDGVTLVNTLAWPRDDAVELTLPFALKGRTLVDGDAAVLMQVLGESGNETRVLVTPVGTPSLGRKRLTVGAIEAASAQSNGLAADKNRLQSDRLIVKLDDNGWIESVFDKQQDREVLAPGMKGNVFETFQDRPTNWDAWDIDQDFEEKPLDLFRLTESRVVETGPIRATIENTYASEHSTITQRVSLYAGIPIVYFDTDVDWHESRVLLKTAFPVNVLSTRATFDIQYGNVERPTHRNTSWDWARFEVCAHKWIDISEGDYGVSLMNDCKYGHDVKDNVLRLTLLRAPYFPHPQDPGWNVSEGNTDQGRHNFKYALYPHAGDWRAAQTVRRAYELNAPQIALPSSGTAFGALADKGWLQLDADNLVVEVVKKAEDDDAVIVRLFEAHGQRGKATMTLDQAPAKVEACDLMERNATPAEHDGAAVRFDYAPYEIKTFRLRF